MNKTRAWLYAFRLRTLPLALSSIFTGSAVAYVDSSANFSWKVFILCIATTVLLQILSNLANDYGDSEKGTDNEERIGPKRAVQAGLLSKKEIKGGIFTAVILCVLVGSELVRVATQGLEIGYGIFFFLLGLSAIGAAIKYTVGEDAYGYKGMGDVFVFVFFGLVGVCGSYYLLAHQTNFALLLPAFSIGALSAGVLNLNNMRDYIGDGNAGKTTLVVKKGIDFAKRFHRVLVVSALLSSVMFVVLNGTSTMQLLFIITVPLFRRHLMAVREIQDPKDYDPQLKVLALSTFLWAVLFAAGMIIGARS